MKQANQHPNTPPITKTERKPASSHWMACQLEPALVRCWKQLISPQWGSRRRVPLPPCSLVNLVEPSSWREQLLSSTISARTAGQCSTAPNVTSKRSIKTALECTRRRNTRKRTICIMCSHSNQWWFHIYDQSMFVLTVTLHKQVCYHDAFRRCQKLSDLSDGATGSDVPDVIPCQMASDTSTPSHYISDCSCFGPAHNSS